MALFYGADSDAPEVKVDQAALKKLGIPVALTAEDSVQATDAVASDQEVQSISQRFQSAGVNLVIGVGGSGSTTWPRAQLDNQSTYKPTYIATSQSSLLSYVESTKGANPYLKYTLLSARRAVELPAVEGPGDQEVRRRLPQGLPVRPDDGAGQPDDVRERATPPTRRTRRSSRPASTWGFSMTSRPRRGRT